MKIVADCHIPYIKEYFGNYGELILKSGRTIHAEDVKDADILIVRSITPVDRNLLNQSKVKFVGSVTAGADHLDTKWLTEAGIQWCSAGGFNAPPVADYVVSVIAAMQTQHCLAKDHLSAAVIGVGYVGRRVVNYLQKLNMAVTVCDPIRAENETNFISTPLQDLSNFDIISVHVPLTRTGKHSTHHFLDKHFFQKQKPGCVLINASRGSVIDSNVLLQHGQHLQWCFDVWEHEPRINQSILAKSKIATPHIAGYSVQSKMRGIEMIYQLACKNHFIQPQSKQPIEMPTTTVNFANEIHTWRDVVLAIFNPFEITMKMQTRLQEEDSAATFDEMRNQFNDRHEFAYSSYSGANLPLREKQILENLGIQSLINTQVTR